MDSKQTVSRPTSTPNLLDQYIHSMTEKEVKAYHIAKDHLGSSFDLGKSLGFIQWKAKQETPPTP